MSFQVCPEMDAHMREVSEGVEGWGHGYLTGAIVAFGLLGMAEAIRAMPHYTPCDEPYPDCDLCGGTGVYDHWPCPTCVWRRWAASSDLLTPEELDAERHGTG
jgi:hypothetical protein